MLFLRASIAGLVVVAAVSEAANLRLGQRKLQTYTPSDDYYSLMLDRVNQARAAEGLPALCTNKKLQDAAQRHSDDQAANNYMDHSGTDGTNSQERITQAGFDWSAVAENVAAGQPDVDAVMDAWMASPGHRENILGDYTMLGCAYAYNADTTYQHYWTQDFGTGDAEECESGGPDTTTVAHIESSGAEDTYTQVPTPTKGGPVKTKRNTYTNRGKTEDSSSGSQEKETEAPCTDTPVVVVDPPPTTETPYAGSKTEDSCSGSQDKETEAPCTDAVDLPTTTDTAYESSEAKEGCSGSHEKETEAPCTDAPVVVDPPTTTETLYESSKTEDSCSGSQEKETEAPYTDTPVVVVNPPTTTETLYESSEAKDSCSGSQEKETEAPYTDTSVVVVDPPVDDSTSQATDAPVVVVDTPDIIQTTTMDTKQNASPYINAPTAELPDNVYTSAVQDPVAYEPHHDKDCTSGF
ncbi:hypothetical protein PF010_g29656 [Phytophthora fragariae]|nr:hypothetical protein PF003_g21443 [Phytophthora fragariae]KAE9061846.1 hypothetical protein PF010_g29656 [Phytophthora fragariae]KAE9268325.1 hypothetical protein PF001_g29693 [Phytophthora fragariae]